VGDEREGLPPKEVFERNLAGASADAIEQLLARVEQLTQELQAKTQHIQDLEAQLQATKT
jgi:hypothetical protein